MAPVTDREEIANELLGRLAELDNLKAAFEDKQMAVEAARQQAEQAADEYAGKIDAMLATGWATVPGLEAQGHVAPRRKGAGRRKTGAAASSGSAADMDNAGLASAS